MERDFWKLKLKQYLRSKPHEVEAHGRVGWAPRAPCRRVRASSGGAAHVTKGAMTGLSTCHQLVFRKSNFQCLSNIFSRRGEGVDRDAAGVVH